MTTCSATVKRVPMPDSAPRPSPLPWLTLAAVVVVLDQISKALVLATLRTGEQIAALPFFNWVLTWNRGAAFSFLSDAGGWQRWLFTLLAVGVSGWIFVMLRQHAGERRLALALALIMGGAIGNVIDRLRFGAVVDFLDFHLAGWHWPAFNVADSAITVGAVLMVIDQLLAPRPKP
jgi:signal peptidase II